MCSALGGRAAEQLIFGKISTGALSDLEKVTKQAYAMVSIYGLNKKIGNISYFDSRGQDMFTKPYSDDRARIIDEEVSKMIEEQYARALSLLKENEEKLTQLAEKLLSKEVIFKEDLELIFGKRIWDEEDKEDSDSNKSSDEVKVEDTSEADVQESIKEELEEGDLRTPPEFKSKDSDNSKESKDE
jgi:cell division protease FtsH